MPDGQRTGYDALQAVHELVQYKAHDLTPSYGLKDFFGGKGLIYKFYAGSFPALYPNVVRKPILKYFVIMFNGTLYSDAITPMTSQ